MQQWFQSISSRERFYVVVGGIAVLIFLFWQILWHPLISKNQQLQKNSEKNQELLEWMQQSAQKAKSMQGGAEGGILTAGSSIGIAEMLLKKYALNNNKPKMDPIGKDSIKISLKEVSFDNVMKLLGDFENIYGFVCTKSTIAPSKSSGSVNARFTLERS